MTTSADAGPAQDSPMCLIRISARPEPGALWHELLRALPANDPVVLDASGVEQIGTGVLQLLFAFERDRLAAGRAVVWQGQSQCFNEARAALGLETKVPADAGTGESCHDA